MNRPISTSLGADGPGPARETLDARQRLELALSAARMGDFDWDVEADVFHVSDRAAVLFGSRAGAHPADGGTRIWRNVHPDDVELARAAVRACVEEGQPYAIEHRLLRPVDGKTMWLYSAGVPVYGEDGRVTRMIGVAQDITERKSAESQRETLVAELDHRVKNVLASVQSLALQSARKATSIDNFLKTFAGRLKAMASAHQLLTAARWRGAGLQYVVAAELGGLAPGQTRWEGPEIVLAPRAANAMSLALHELATNAVKFGALSTEQGHVDVRWSRSAEGGFELEWRETGGPLVSAPTRQGFGSTLLDKVTGREIGGEARVEFLSTGVRAVLRSGPEVVVADPQAQVAVDAGPSETVPTVAGASAGDGSGALASKVGGLRVLIVEDAMLLSVELEAGLTEAGVQVIGQAADLAEALSMLDRPMDAAVLDANLNGVSVEPVARALAARGVPFMFATGYGEDTAAPIGFDAPAIRKPYDVTQVAAALAELTGRG